jgi:signal transduction histidine kinase
LDGGHNRAAASGHNHGAAAGDDHSTPMTLSANVWSAAMTPTSKQVVDTRVCDCCQTSAAMTSKGPVVVFRDRSAAEIRDIAISRYVDGAWTASAPVHADNWEVNFCPVNGPAIVASGDTVAVTWFTGARDPSKVQVAYSTDAGATFGAPIRVRDEVFGNLYLTDKRDGTAFTAADEVAVLALATVAGAAIAHTTLEQRSDELSVTRERERIARDLHDTVIQELYATGLGLESALRTSHGTLAPDVTARLELATERIGATIKQIRATIFGLSEAGATEVGVRDRILALVEEVGVLLPAAPRVLLIGPLDTVVTPSVLDHILAVLRESLTNVVRHAQAASVTVRIEAADARLELEVGDDGVGLEASDGGPPHGLGLANIRTRAAELGGAARVESAPLRGTRVIWSVPL